MHSEKNQSMPKRKFVLVRMEQIGEPTFSPDGQSMIHVRMPWLRDDDACWIVGLEDIVSTFGAYEGLLY